MKKEFLGSGWTFPVSLDNRNEFKLVSQEEDIAEAILIILSTVPGERVMRPEFGCGIHNYVFSVINSSTLLIIENEIRKALTLYEPRVVVEEVRTQIDNHTDGGLLIHIGYTVASSNSRYNMVYPFYLTEKG